MSKLERRDRARAAWWDFPLPTPKRPKYPRFHVVNQQLVEVTLISHRVHEIGTHYVDGRTVPCTEYEGKCWLDHRLVGSGRYGCWLAVVPVGFKLVHLLRLTPCALTIESRLRDPDLGLRGLKLQLWRTGKHERTEMQARLILDRSQDPDLPPEPDVRFAVERMLGAEDRPDRKNKDGQGVLQRAAAAAAAAAAGK
jgi:hypothetical protein